MYMLRNILILGRIQPLAMWQKLMTAQDFLFFPTQWELDFPHIIQTSTGRSRKSFSENKEIWRKLYWQT